jgi:cell division protein FtsL
MGQLGQPVLKVRGGEEEMRQTTILTLLLAAVMSVALFYLKYEVTDLEQELDVLNRAIVTDQEGIHVLKAEWSHLNDVARIKDLASRYLEMKPTEPTQIKSIEDLGEGLADQLGIREGDEQAIEADKVSAGSTKKGARR